MSLCAEPTPQGEQLLDPFHLCGRVKRLRDKPVQSFAGSDTFLRIAQAEKEGLIEVRIDVGPLHSHVLPPPTSLILRYSLPVNFKGRTMEL